MAKLSPIPRYTKDGTKKYNGYKITISQGDADVAGFTENSKLKVVAEKGELKIIEEKN
ncbi:MAG: hypothetical protein HFJ52_01020 [Clostridia bacterium]|nr:hypothetical protein [Clostridia bacterium]